MSSTRTCRNRRESWDLPGYWVQDGYKPDGSRNMIFHKTRWEPINCGYDAAERAADDSCGSCPRRHKP